VVGPVWKSRLGPECYDVAQFEAAHKLAISCGLATALVCESHNSLSVVFRVDVICVAPDNAVHLVISLSHHIVLDCEMILGEERVLEGIFPGSGTRFYLREDSAQIVELQRWLLWQWLLRLLPCHICLCGAWFTPAFEPRLKPRPRAVVCATIVIASAEALIMALYGEDDAATWLCKQCCWCCDELLEVVC